MRSQSILATLLICLSAVIARSTPQRQLLPRNSLPLDLSPEEVARLEELTPLQRVAELFPGTVSDRQLQLDGSGARDRFATDSDSSDDDNDFS